SKYTKQMYLDALSLMYDLLNKARKDGMVALEADVDEPENSAIFQKYPNVTKNHHALDFICDYLRMMVSAKLNSFEIEALMTSSSTRTTRKATRPRVRCPASPTDCPVSGSWRPCS